MGGVSASPALVEVIARAVAEDMYAAERDHPEGDVVVAGRVFPVLYVASRDGVHELSRHLASRESIVDFAAAHRYTVAARTSVELVLFVATTHRLFVVEHRDGQLEVGAHGWDTVKVDRKRLSVLPRVEQSGATVVVEVRGDFADWLEDLRRRRPAEAVGRLATALASR